MIWAAGGKICAPFYGKLGLDCNQNDLDLQALLFYTACLLILLNNCNFSGPSLQLQTLHF